jgi:hypothetical protein
MWISLFTLVCGVAVCLSVAAVMMERGGLQLLRRSTSKTWRDLSSGRPRAARIVLADNGWGRENLVRRCPPWSARTGVNATEMLRCAQYTR